MIARSDPVASLPIGEYAFPGRLREQLVGAILSGTKTSTTSLLEEYRRDQKTLPRVGDEEVVVDSDNVPVCVTRNTAVDVVRLADVSDGESRASPIGLRRCPGDPPGR